MEINFNTQYESSDLAKGLSVAEIKPSNSFESLAKTAKHEMNFFFYLCKILIFRINSDMAQSIQIQQFLLSKQAKSNLNNINIHEFSHLLNSLQIQWKFGILSPLLQTAQLIQHLNVSAINLQGILMKQLLPENPEEKINLFCAGNPNSNLESLNIGSHLLPYLDQIQQNDNEILKKNKLSKKIKKSNLCGHPEREHYAKNLCYSCYQKHGRTKKPWNCSHDKLHAHGLCQNCYINQYHKKQNQSKKLDLKAEDYQSNPESGINHQTRNDEFLTLKFLNLLIKS